MPDHRESLLAAIRACADLPESERVAAYNAAARELGRLVSDLGNNPASSPQLLPVGAIDGNAYNPNRVAGPELDLLEESIRADGLTMAVVVMAVGERWEVVDGFHRHLVASQRLGRRYLPCAVIDRPIADRMASTVRHNRARGRHQVDLMAALVRGMIGLGWGDERIAQALGMSVEELLRLCQVAGCARILAAESYGRSWANVVPPDGEEPSE